MEFDINELVVLRHDGLSKITGVTKMYDKEYFVVHIYRGASDDIFVPFDKANLNMRKIMKQEDADKVLKSIKTIEKEFNTNTKQRRDSYKRRLSSGEIEDIAYLYGHYQLLKEFSDEVKLGPVDIEMLAHAEDMFLDELAITYNQKREEIDNFVRARIKEL